MGFFRVCALCRKSGSILTPHARHKTEICFFLTSLRLLGEMWQACNCRYKLISCRSFCSINHPISFCESKGFMIWPWLWEVFFHDDDKNLCAHLFHFQFCSQIGNDALIYFPAQCLPVKLSEIYVVSSTPSECNTCETCKR